MINAEQLNTIKERAAKATPGPWRSAGLYGVRTQNAEAFSIPLRPEDATFIAHAREDVPALVAEVERLQISDASKEASSIRYYNDYQTEKMKCSATLYELIRAEEENARLRKALEFYGNPSTYHTLTSNFGMLILQDEGIRARRALQGRETLE